MARPKKKKQSNPGRLGRVAFAALVATAVLALAFFLVLRTEGQISVAENALGTVLSPLQRAFSGATLFIRDTVSGVKDYFRMSEDLEEAKQQITDLKLQLIQYTEAQIENERLKSLLEAKTRYQDQEPVLARVIARNPGVWFDTFSINKGTLDGVGNNMAVVMGDGLVGLTYDVGATYAKVLSIIDARARVAVLVERTRDTGIMYGQIAADAATPECRVMKLPAVNDVAPGDIVITSGTDGYYPKGIKVGEVTQVSRQQSDVSDRYIDMMPSVDFQHIEEVIVLTTRVERDDDALNPLPTPTPKPTPQETPQPSPTPNPSAGVPGLDDVFEYPDSVGDQLSESGELIESTMPPNYNPSQGGTAPEEDWSN